MLHHAWEHSAYYRRTFEAAGILEEQLDELPLSCFPTIDKKEFLEHFDELVVPKDLHQHQLRKFDAQESPDRKPYKGEYHVVHSSGSTGKPGYFVYDEAAWNSMLPGMLRAALWNMSMPQILSLLAKRPRIVYIAATDGRYGGAMAVGDGIDGIGTSQIYLDIKTPLEEWIRQITQFKPNFYGASESLTMGVEMEPEVGMILFDDMNYIEVESGVMYLTCLYNFAQPLIRYRISDSLTLKAANENSPYPYTRAIGLLGRNEDILWFEDFDGNREFLHPLAIEGFCIEGLLDYQFRQTGKDTFEMYAEVSKSASRDFVRAEILRQMRGILSEKKLDYVQFYVYFVDEILPDERTGKKPLILSGESLTWKGDTEHYEESAVAG